MKKRKQKRSKTSKPTVGVGWYRENQWSLLLEHSADRADLEATYAEWLGVACRSMENLSEAGIQFKKIPIDVEELVQWCQEKGYQVDGNSRSEFIALKTREEFSG